MRVHGAFVWCSMVVGGILAVTQPPASVVRTQRKTNKSNNPCLSFIMNWGNAEYKKEKIRFFFFLSKEIDWVERKLVDCFRLFVAVFSLTSRFAGCLLSFRFCYYPQSVSSHKQVAPIWRNAIIILYFIVGRPPPVPWPLLLSAASTQFTNEDAVVKKKNSSILSRPPWRTDRGVH